MRKKCIKFLTFFIISLLSCVLFSADTKALELTSEVEFTGRTISIGDLYCKYQNNTTTVEATSCKNYPDSTKQNLTLVRKNAKISTTEDYYYMAFLGIKSIGENGAVLYRLDTDWSNFALVSVREVSNDYVQSWITINQSQSQYSGTVNNNSYAKFYEVVLRAKHTGDYYFTLGNGSNPFVWANLASPNSIHITLSDISEYKSSGSSALNEKDDEDRSNIESQQESSSYDSGESASEATETGTTLLGAFTAFVGALTSATPSNCVLDMDLGNLDMGNVDFCTLSPPAGFSALASVFLILFCVPLSIATARKIINLFRSFQ